MKAETFEEKLDVLTGIILQSRPQLTPEDVKTAASQFYSKLMAAHYYKVCDTLVCDVLLIKAEDSGSNDSDGTYRLSEICAADGLTVKTVSGDHRSFVGAENCDNVVAIMQEWM